MGANGPKLHLMRYLQALSVPRHHTSEFCFSSKSRLEACSERLRVRDHAVHEARFVDRVRRILCDFERPQEKCKVDEDRAIRDVLSGADSTRWYMSKYAIDGDWTKTNLRPNPNEGNFRSSRILPSLLSHLSGSNWSGLG
jgi:hypothetical protein